MIILPPGAHKKTIYTEGRIELNRTSLPESRNCQGLLSWSCMLRARIQARKLEDGAEDSMAQANKMLSMSTITFQNSRNRDALEARDAKRKMRQLQRKMKARGMKLQYADDDEIFFEDVAGIGIAKVLSSWCFVERPQCDCFQ